MKKIFETKTYESMMAHRAAANPIAPYSGKKAWANIKFKFPVFRSGKMSKYIRLLTCIGKTGSTWVNALNELGIAPEMQRSSYFCCYRYSMLNHGLIKKAGRIGRKQKYVLTDLGDRYVAMALRRAT
jgi:hypothetical protein